MKALMLIGGLMLLGMAIGTAVGLGCLWVVFHVAAWLS